MLFLVGLGLSEGDLSAKALKKLIEIDKLYIESYTAPISKGYINYIKEATGKIPVSLKRSQMEEGAETTVGEALDNDIAILIPGDPLIATTHHILLDAARKRGIETTVFHASSIFSAGIGVSGLDIYKFGPTTTIPFISKNYKPTSFLDVIKKNLDVKEHTLVLLDVNPEKNETMGIKYALNTIKTAEESRGTDILHGKSFLVLSDIDGSNEEVVITTLESYNSALWDRFTGLRISIIIPATLSFAEEDTIKRFVRIV